MDAENKGVEKSTLEEEKDMSSLVPVEPHLDVREKDKLQRRLHQRHIQMCVLVFLSLLAHSDGRKGLLYVLGRDFSDAGPITDVTFHRSRGPLAPDFSSYVLPVRPRIVL